MSRDVVIDALCAPALAPVVDLVLWVQDGVPHAANHLGRVALSLDGTRTVLAGADPIGSEDPMAFLPYELERTAPSPPVSTENAYPYAARRILSFFADADRSPDVAIVHTPRHFYPDEGGHVGEHGSLDVIQSRAPLILAGAGVWRRGLVDDHARLVDVGPTLATLAGVPAADLVDGRGEPLDGRALTAYLDPRRPPTHVIGILWDGAHCGEVLCLAQNGKLPHLSRLLERGLALRGGAVAEFPSVTLTNHTSILTGVGPGRHGVLGNVYYDRATGARVVPNDAETWHRSAEWLRPGVRTVFEMVGDHVAPTGSARTASIDEAVDRGADYSTMGILRAAGGDTASTMNSRLPDPHASPYVGNLAFLEDPSYAWSVQVDDAGLEQVLQLWADPGAAPRLTWWANVVTDAGLHGAGPRTPMSRDAMRQSDARLGVFLDHLEFMGVLDDVAILLTADHGFEGSDPAVTGSWRATLDGLGIPYRDEGPGFVYLL